MATEPPATNAEPSTLPPSSVSLGLVSIAGLSIFCALFFLSPNTTSDNHRNDGSLLRPIINLMAIANSEGTASRFPTPLGVEIRDLFFHLGAALLTVVMGLVFLLRPPSYALESQHVLDIKRQAQNPIAWFVLLLFISLVSSFFSPSPDISMGGVILRLMTLGWWLPLALLLRREHAQSLAVIMTGVLTLIAMLGISYWFVRDLQAFPEGPQLGRSVAPRLIFPMGNPTLLGACMLPGIFVGFSGLLSRTKSSGNDKKAASTISIVLGSVCAIGCLVVLYLTSGRAAQVGFFAGLFMIAVALIPKKQRMLVLLLLLVLGVAGMNYVNNLRESGVMGDRSHSIRSRLNHEWPYAINLWTQKLVGGHGEGGYTMQTGPLVRSEQLQDPNVLAVDGVRWTAHAHNEYLELLSNLGLAGALSFVAALALTFWQALRFLDHADASATARSLIIALMAALFAMAIEEGASVSLHKPGFAPLFFTTWACLFAMTRSAHAPNDAVEKTAHSERNVRIMGAAALLFAFGMAYAGVQNWRGTRAQMRANDDRAAGAWDNVIEQADFAGSNILYPFRRIIARQTAIEARVIAFAQQVDSAPEIDDGILQRAQQAHILWSELDKAVPRFMDMSHLAFELEHARYRAYARRNDMQQATASIIDYAVRLEQCRADEPFTLPYLQRLWSDYVVVAANNQVIPSLDPIKRWTWLREYLRRNTIDPSVQAMIRSLTRYPLALQILNDRINIARQDAEQDPSAWEDPLSPETLRLAAEIAKLNDQSNALDFVDTAIAMYQAAGGRLFTAHAAALRESAQIMLVQNPDADPEAALTRLVTAYEVLEGPLTGSMKDKIAQPLPGALGQTRLALLLANGDEAAARAQIAALFQGTDDEQQQQLANSYIRLAESFANAPQHAERALSYIAKGEALSQATRHSRLLATQLNLLNQNMSLALDAARGAIEIEKDRAPAYVYLQQLEMRFPDATIWNDLRSGYDDYPALPQPAPPLTTQPTMQGTNPVVNDEVNAKNARSAVVEQ